MEMPLIFDENGDVSLYWSLKDAQRNIEAIDVKNDEYVGYDAIGRLLSLKAINLQSSEISLAEDRPLHAQDVVVALRRYIAERQTRKDLESFSLTELLAIIETNKIKN